jgi:hypothetical protein
MEAVLLFVGSWPFAFLPPLPVISAPVWLVFGFVSLIALRLRLCFSQRGLGGEKRRDIAGAGSLLKGRPRNRGGVFRKDGRA